MSLTSTLRCKKEGRNEGGQSFRFVRGLFLGLPFGSCFVSRRSIPSPFFPFYHSQRPFVSSSLLPPFPLQSHIPPHPSPPIPNQTLLPACLNHPKHSLVGSPLAEQLDVALIGDLLNVTGKSLNGSHLDVDRTGWWFAEQKNLCLAGKRFFSGRGC
jgi:hypothetical protein